MSPWDRRCLGNCRNHNAQRRQREKLRAAFLGLSAQYLSFPGTETCQHSAQRACSCSAGHPTLARAFPVQHQRSLSRGAQVPFPLLGARPVLLLLLLEHSPQTELLGEIATKFLHKAPALLLVQLENNIVCIEPSLAQRGHNSPGAMRSLVPLPQVSFPQAPEAALCESPLQNGPLHAAPSGAVAGLGHIQCWSCPCKSL